MVLLTDGAENEAPYISEVKDAIVMANPRLKIFSVGLGFAVEPAKLQSITNVADGYHQVVDQLTGHAVRSGIVLFQDLRQRCRAEAGGRSNRPGRHLHTCPTMIERARIVTSDRSATFVILDEPALRQFYTLEFVSPKGVIIQPGSIDGGCRSRSGRASITGSSASCSRISRWRANTWATGSFSSSQRGNGRLKMPSARY